METSGDSGAMSPDQYASAPEDAQASDVTATVAEQAQTPEPIRIGSRLFNLLFTAPYF